MAEDDSVLPHKFWQPNNAGPGTYALFELQIQHQTPRFSTLGVLLTGFENLRQSR